MSMTCKVCRSGQREAIDELIVSGIPLRKIAAEYSLTESSLHRHRGKCLAGLLKQKSDLLNGEGLLKQMQYLQEKALGILKVAEQCGDLRTALIAIREARGNLELANKLMVESELEARISTLEKELGGER